jgi:transcriptional regulator with XRE-family HTH domain
MIGMAAASPLSARIKRARGLRRWTQQQLADALEVDRKTVDNWENGRTIPRNLAIIEDVLGDLGEEDLERYTDPVEAELWALTHSSELIDLFREKQHGRRRAG